MLSKLSEYHSQITLLQNRENQDKFLEELTKLLKEFIQKAREKGLNKLAIQLEDVAREMFLDVVNNLSLAI